MLVVKCDRGHRIGQVEWQDSSVVTLRRPGPSQRRGHQRHFANFGRSHTMIDSVVHEEY